MTLLTSSIRSASIAWVLTLTSLGLLSCHKDEVTNDAGVFLSREVLWRYDRIHGGRPTAIGNIDANLVFGDLVVVAGADDTPTSKLIALDAYSGAARWTWSDLQGSRDTEGVGIISYARSGDTIVYTAGSRIYAIDITSGETVWRERDLAVPFSPNDMQGANGHFYGMACSPQLPTRCVETVHRGDFARAGGVEEVIVPAHPIDSFVAGYSTDVTTFEILPPPHDHKAIVVYHQGVAGDRYAVEFAAYFGLYDLRAGAWDYANVRLGTKTDPVSSVGTPARYADGDIFISVREDLFCYEALTGEMKWAYELPSEVFTSGITIAEGLCLANCEDRRLYGLDAATGQRLWDVESAQIGSPIHERVLDGVVYWVGGSDKSLFAADIRTGELVWKLDAERMIKGAPYFNVFLAAVPGRGGEPGRIIAHAGEEVICLEAHR